jgi:formylglycine-generating enzyme required for sulfatase activity
MTDILRVRNAIAVACAALFFAGCGSKTDVQPKSAETPSQSPGNTVKTACGMEMVLIPAGEFIMGVNEGAIDVKPAHPVKLDAFLMDQYEMTQDIYEKVTGKNPSRQKNPRNPVEQVNWGNAVKFCNLRSTQEGLIACYNPETWECNFEASGYRLPTEAEWEYACKAGSTNRFYFGDRPDDLKSNGWFDGNSQSKPHPVAHWKPNAWGLYDMTGNVWEWCNDYYGTKYYRASPKENPRGPAEGEKRVLRGGSWSSKADDCTSFARNCDEAGFTDICLTMDSNGFRCVRRTPKEREKSAP